MRKIGFTTTIPVEVILAAKCIPVDLNNVFITDSNPEQYIEYAEIKGFPRNTCSWIKGIYGVLLKRKGIDELIGVVEGDCSNTRALLEVLNLENIKYITFSYPYDKNKERLMNEIKKLVEYFEVTWQEVQTVKERLDSIRMKLMELDRLTWEENKVSGFENHLWLVSSSDFNGDPDKFEKDLEEFLKEAKNRAEKKEKVRMGYIGVPPIFSDLYEFIEDKGGRVVFNEVQRQFSIFNGIGKDILSGYLDFTYPYDLKNRLDDIKKEIKRRNIHGIIHYVQSFCFRGIEDIIIKNEMDIPVLTLEGDKPGKLDARTKLRLEAFLDMLR